ncbi:MAG: 5-formyltetrahydrofolate cyclo-ligase [Candidatus Nitrotoga sp.]
MSISFTKQALRERIIAQREQLSPVLRVVHSAAITERLLQLPEYQRANAVLGYMNFGMEFASEIWIQQVLADGKKLALPRVNRHTMQLDLYWVDDLGNQLAAGMGGIREPIVERCERMSTLFEVEFALLPGVAFTRDGGRLGYGGGFYDKLLAQLQDVNQTPYPSLVAAAFAMQVVPGVPLETTDVKVEWLVTEHETIRCADV